MKRMVLLLVLATAYPAAAQETTSTAGTATRTAAVARKAEGKNLTTPATAVADSPLVQAANRSRKAKHDKKVITNETLKEMNKGRITTTNTQADLPAPVVKSDSEVAEELQATRQAATKKEDEARAAEKTKSEAAQKDEKARRAAAYAEGEGYLDSDEMPASALEPEKPKQP